MPVFGSAFCFGTRIGFCYPRQKGQEDRLNIGLTVESWVVIRNDESPCRNQDRQHHEHGHNGRMQQDGQ